MNKNFLNLDNHKKTIFSKNKHQSSLFVTNTQSTTVDGFLTQSQYQQHIIIPLSTLRPTLLEKYEVFTMLMLFISVLYLPLFPYDYK